MPITVRPSSGDVEVTGFTRDLSTSGVFLYTSSAMLEGSEFEMVLMLPPELTAGERRWVCCQAAVVRVESAAESSGFGIAASIRNMQVLPEILP